MAAQQQQDPMARLMERLERMEKSHLDARKEAAAQHKAQLKAVADAKASEGRHDYAISQPTRNRLVTKEDFVLKLGIEAVEHENFLSDWANLIRSHLAYQLMLTSVANAFGKINAFGKDLTFENDTLDEAGVENGTIVLFQACLDVAIGLGKGAHGDLEPVHLRRAALAR